MRAFDVALLGSLLGSMWLVSCDDGGCPAGWKEVDRVCMPPDEGDGHHDAATPESGRGGSSGNGAALDGGASGSGSNVDGGGAGNVAAGSGGSVAAGSGGSTAAGSGGAAGSTAAGSGGTTAQDAGQQPCTETCAGDTPICDESMGQCVACLQSTDCDNDLVCSDERTCVLCVLDGDCPNGQVCTEEHQCTQCVDDGDCSTVTAAHCDTATHACVACTQDAQCAHLAQTPVCDETNGECVECTEDTEQQCGGNACAISRQQCTETTRHTLGACAPCTADAECRTGLACVEQTFGGPALGSFCFYIEGTVGCSPDEPSRKAFSVVSDDSLTSVEGVEGPYCLPVTTCTAYGHATNYMNMGPKTCADDDDCGAAAMDDGHCTVGGAANNRCTYECTTSDDCPTAGLTTCSASGDAGPTYCALP